MGFPIPIFYETEGVNKDFLRDILMGNISDKDVREFKMQMVGKRKTCLITMLVCAVFFAAGLCFIFLTPSTYEPPVSVFALLMIFGFLLPGVVAAITSSSLAVSQKYLSALKRCHPGGIITSTSYRKYNFIKKDDDLLKGIADYRFSVDEARGFLNIAKDACSTHIKFVVVLVTMAVAAYFVLSLVFMGITGDNESAGQFMSGIPIFTAAFFGLFAVVYLLFALSVRKYIRAINSSYFEERAEKREVMTEALLELREDTALASVRLTPYSEAADLLSSKLGGLPYLPPGFDYPQGKYGYLNLLVQLNFEKLPELPGFPNRGILQFYVSSDGFDGMSLDMPVSQDDFRVVFHDGSVWVDNESSSQPPPLARDYHDYDMFPFDEELQLFGELEQVFIPAFDFRFTKHVEDRVVSLYNAVFSASESLFSDLPKDVFYDVFKLFRSGGHRIGGYPGFAHKDPRMDNEQFSNHTVLLLQIDLRQGRALSNHPPPAGDTLFAKEGKKETHPTISKEGGSAEPGDLMLNSPHVLSFFITPEKLEARDFSDVICIQ